MGLRSGLLVVCPFLLVQFPRGRGKPRLFLVFVLRTKSGAGGALLAGAAPKAADQPTCFLTSGSASPASDFGSNRSGRSSSRSVRKCMPLTTLSDLMNVLLPLSSPKLSSLVRADVIVVAGGGGDDEDDDVQISNVMSVGKLGSWSG